MFSKANLVSCFLKNRSNIREDNRVRPRLLVVKRAQRIVHGSTTIPPLPTVFLRKFTTFSYRSNYSIEKRFTLKSLLPPYATFYFYRTTIEKSKLHRMHSFLYCVLATLFLCTRDVQYRNSCTSLFFFFIFFYSIDWNIDEKRYIFIFLKIVYRRRILLFDCSSSRRRCDRHVHTWTNNV